ncbi:MAG TPA: PilZ domain-containing protein [Gemmataceae bacterium]|nr:PilZ domain-containing protein [Gemmataceae bacterium]
MLEPIAPLVARRKARRAGERRAEVRHPCNLNVAFRPLAKRHDEFRVARALDISMGGIGLFVEEEVRPGTILAVELLHRGRSQRMLLARVAHTAAYGEAAYLLGCEFASGLSPDDLQALL